MSLIDAARLSLEPVPAYADLDSVECRVPVPEICVGNVPPAARDFEGLRVRGCDLNPASAASHKVEGRGIAPRKIFVGVKTASPELDERHNPATPRAGNPTQDYRIKPDARNTRRELHEYWDEVGPILEPSAIPPVTDLGRQRYPNENARGEDLRFRECVEALFARCSRSPPAEIQAVVLDLRWTLCLKVAVRATHGHNAENNG